MANRGTPVPVSSTASVPTASRHLATPSPFPTAASASQRAPPDGVNSERVAGARAGGSFSSLMGNRASDSPVANLSDSFTPASIILRLGNNDDLFDAANDEELDSDGVSVDDRDDAAIVNEDEDSPGEDEDDSGEDEDDAGEDEDDAGEDEDDAGEGEDAPGEVGDPAGEDDLAIAGYEDPAESTRSMDQDAPAQTASPENGECHCYTLHPIAHLHPRVPRL